MRVLAIETATAWGSVALVDADGVLAERAAHVPGGHLEWLASAIADALSSAGLRQDAVDGLAVSTGPGSFTGLRIGIATAASWAHTMNRPLIALSTMDIIAAGVDTSGLVLTVLDVRRGEVAGALFRGGDRLQRLTDDLVAAPELLQSRLPAVEASVVVAGDALERHERALHEALAPWAVMAPREQWWPRAAVSGALGRRRLLAGERVDPLRVRPVYVRRPDASPYTSERRVGKEPA